MIDVNFILFIIIFLSIIIVLSLFEWVKWVVLRKNQLKKYDVKFFRCSFCGFIHLSGNSTRHCPKCKKVRSYDF